MNKAAEHLQGLGLSGKQAEVYVALHKIGEGTAYEVAKESGLKRPTVYLVLEELRKKGLALVIPHPKKQLFIARDPHEFLAEVQTRFARDSRALLGLLPSLARPSSSVRVFKGSGALKQGLSYGLHAATEKKVVAFYAGVYPHTKIAPVYTEHLHELGEMDFGLRSIVPANSLDHSFRANDAKYGFRTKKVGAAVFHPQISVEVMGDCTKLILQKTNEVVILEDAPSADFFKQLFEMVWDISK